MADSLANDLERILNGMAQAYADEGKAREVALLAYGKPRIEETNYDNWNGGTYGFTVYVEAPPHLYAQIAGVREQLERSMCDKAKDFTRMYENEYIQAWTIVTELPNNDHWREEAIAWLRGEGITNQGRARSDNVAPLMADGLLFRSQPEIHLYRALKSQGISFAPLPVFVRGGQTYRRLEPDFVLLKDGIVLVVEVDGATVHRESPAEAHDRMRMLVHEGALVERVHAKDCDTPEKGKACAERLLAIIAKHRTNK
jgi:hypothetical protein